MIVKLIDTGYESLANCYLLADKEGGSAAVIDPGAGDDRSALHQILADLHCKLEYILLTHGHFDHILGVHALRERYGAKVVIHPEDAMCLADCSLSLAQDFGLEHLQKSTRTDVLVQDGDELQLGDLRIKVISTPGHTPGGVCYLIEEEKTIFTGDTLFCLTVGRTDFPRGDGVALKQSIQKLLTLQGDYRILPGHNRETTLDHERVRNIFIRRM